MGIVLRSQMIDDQEHVARRLFHSTLLASTVLQMCFMYEVCYCRCVTETLVLRARHPASLPAWGCQYILEIWIETSTQMSDWRSFPRMSLSAYASILRPG